MRLYHLICGELRLLRSYGILLLYGVFLVLYLLLLSLLPTSAKQTAAAILIFTDPAAMGLFFLGSLVLFEKSQRVNCALAVSPIRLYEYLAAKVIPLLLVGSFVSCIISIYARISQPLLVLAAVALSSALFSLCGLFAAVKTNSLNAFVIAVVPFEVFLCVPAVLSLFSVLKSELWLLHPGVAAIALISGRLDQLPLCFFSILVSLVLVYLFSRRAVDSYLKSLGGGKL